jgi:hypothetical protein
MLAEGALDAKGYRISKLDFDGSNSGLRGATRQKGKLARETIRLAGALIPFVLA